MLDAHEFQTHSEDTLRRLYRALAEAAEDYNFDTDYHDGALLVEFEDPPAKFVISPNAPVRQIWVSAHARSFKLDWDEVESTFVLGASGKTLKQLLEEAIGRQVGAEVTL